MKMTRSFVLMAVVAGAASLGCGGNSAAPVRLAGKVSYNGTAVTAGTMSFHTADGTIYPGLINTDGSYTATDLPVGEVVVTIETESLNPNKKAEGTAKEQKDAKRRSGMMQKAPEGAVGGPTPTYVKIPAKYADKKTSPLKLNLERNTKSKDFDLTD